jgi:uncharacterized protein YecE (DUF72 family)
MKATEYRVGCASWLDSALLAEGTFYPAPIMSAEDRLRWYARFFDCVEVNATYYGLPAYHTSQAWVDRTPPNFRFAVKAYALMTGHHPKARALVKELRALLPKDVPINARGEIERRHFGPEARDLCFGWFRDALRPLKDAGKLSYILFQLAPWVGFSTRAVDYLASLPERLPGCRIAVEFRNPSWIPKRAGEVLSFLAEHRLAFVAIDAPWQALIPEATADVAVLRLHGRNLEGWHAQMRGRRPSVAEKYDYLYSTEELHSLAETAQSLEGTGEEIYITFNNNNRDYPVRNGLAFRKLLGQAPPDLERLRTEYQPPPTSQAARTSTRPGRVHSSDLEGSERSSPRRRSRRQ